VVGLVVAAPDGYLLTVCENGYGKRTPFGPNIAGEEPPEAEGEEAPEEPVEPVEPAEDVTETTPEGEEESKDRSTMRYRKQRRGGKGVRDIRTSDRNGVVVNVAAVRDGDDIMLITSQGMVNRSPVTEIRVVGRNTQGVRIMNLREGDKIASIAKVAKEDIDASPELVDEPPPVGQPTDTGPEGTTPA
jgi:DNA gyrase subunit A